MIIARGGSTASDEFDTSNFVLGEVSLQVISFILVWFVNRRIPTTTIICSVQVRAIKLGLLCGASGRYHGGGDAKHYLLQSLVDFVVDRA